MTKLAPRQGIFAIILLVSFIIQMLILVFNTEKRQSDARMYKGEKIVEQLSKESLASIVNQDHISLSVLLNRYQVDNEITSLIITDKDKRVLANIGEKKLVTQQVIEQDVMKNNQMVGQVIVVMKDVVKSDIIKEQLWFIIASLLLHILVWLCYRYTSRPTNEQLLLVQEKIQQNLLKNQRLNQLSENKQENLSTVPEKEQVVTGKTIDDYLNKNTKKSAYAETISNVSSNMADNTMSVPKTQVVIQFFDENSLLKHVAPELSEPHYQLCEELLQQTIYQLFNTQQLSDILQPYMQGVMVERINTFSKDGVMFNLLGDDDKLAMAGVLVSKLFIILNQVMYEKHRELGRFALPVQVGICINQQHKEMNQLMFNHGKEDGILLRLPENMIKPLLGKVQLKDFRSASTLAEREMLCYEGLSEILMESLIAERDKILRYTK